MSSVSLINGHIDDDNKKQTPRIDFDKLIPEDYVIECATMLVEKQEDMLLKTIQHIGNTVHINFTIDKNKVIEALTDYQRKINGTADLVEAVRCRDCKYYDNGECTCHSEPPHQRIYERWTVEVYENDYCSYGERRYVK